MRKYALVFAALISVLLPACGPSPTPDPTSTLTTTPTGTATAAPWRFLFLTPTPTCRNCNPSQTELLTITPEPSATNTPTMTLKPFKATGTAVEATRVAPFVGTICEYETQRSGGMSPDGNWAFCGYPNVTAMRRDGQMWTFSMDDFFGESGWNYDVRPMYWTQDGKFLFFAPIHLMDWGDDTYYYPVYFALLRMDLNTGKVDTVLPLENGFETYYLISISPTGRRLVYSHGGKTSVRDLKTNAEYSWVEYSGFASDFSWSADGTELRYKVFGEGGLYMVRVDVQNNALPVRYAITPEPTRTVSP